MVRSLIVARIQPGAEANVARVFAESDKTELPAVAGVTERTLYSLRDLYIHVIDFERDEERGLSAAQRHPGFREVSDRLAEYISPYDPDWRSPRDALAQRFYHWKA